MNNYTIYCTEAQTKKALKLGAPIEKLVNHSIDKEICDKYHFLVIDRVCYNNPTAEQLIGWLEEQGIVIIFMATINDDESGYTWIAHACHFQDESVWIDTKNLSRKEATLAAIDAALEYLSKNK